MYQLANYTYIFLSRVPRLPLAFISPAVDFSTASEIKARGKPGNETTYTLWTDGATLEEDSMEMDSVQPAVITDNDHDVERSRKLRELRQKCRDGKPRGSSNAH